MRHFALIGCLLSVHCAGQQAISLPRVAVQATLHSATAATAVSPLQKLRDGEEVELTLRLNRPEYLYVIEYWPTGQSKLWFPASPQQSQPTSGSVSVRVTRSSAGPDAPKKLNLYVVAATAPLDATYCLLLRIPCPGGRLLPRGDDKKPPPPPEPKQVKRATPKDEGKQERNPEAECQIANFDQPAAAGLHPGVSIQPVVVNYE